MITTNLEFNRWDSVFGDDKIAASVIDRAVHHSKLVEFVGPNHRLEEPPCW